MYSAWLVLWFGGENFMKDIIIQLVSVFIGNLGFSYLFKVPKKLRLLTSFGGVLSWALFLLFDKNVNSIFLPCMFTSVAAALYSEIQARILKTPATVFLIMALIPLLPGGNLYYTMSNVVQKNWHDVRYYGIMTIEYALAIAVGISIVWAAEKILMQVKARR